jgi:hypothetical protein
MASRLFKTNKISSDYQSFSSETNPRFKEPGLLQQLKRGQQQPKKNKLISHLGKPLKAKLPSQFTYGLGKVRNSDDRKWVCLVFIFVLMLAGAIIFMSMSREDNHYRKSQYYK